MREYLVFRLHGALASWGEIAVGELRPSSIQPTKSAVMGLLAAAVGLRREDEARLLELQKSCGFAVRVDAPGIPIRDYHTIKVPSSGQTILSERDYRCDALYTVVLWALSADPRPSLRELADALRQPAFVPYLGRKSCPLALPMSPRLVDAASLAEALDKAQFPEVRCLPLPDRAEVFWDEGCESGLAAVSVFRRRDSLFSRRRW